MVILLYAGGEKLTYGQYLSGATIGSYSGVNSMVHNPAMLAGSRYYLDINVISAGTFFHNNYAYISREDYTTFGFLRPGYEFPMHEKEYGDGERPAYTVENTRRKYLNSNSRIIGPSAMLALNDHVFALQTAFRSVSSMRDLPYDMANYFYYSLDYKPQHGIEYEHRDPIKFASLTWSEIGLSWAYTFKKYDRDRWAFGVTAKILMGHAGSYVYMDHLQYFVPDDDNLYIRNVDGEAAYSLPIDYSSNEISGSKFKGMGLGIDLGISYTHTEKGHSNINYRRPCQQRYEEYKYKLGISLMDIGWIRFTDEARLYDYDNVGGVWEQIDTLSAYYDNLDYISSDISNRLYGDPDEALVGDKFSMFLPATLGLQFDYHYRKNWYVASLARLPLNFARSQVRIPGNLVIAPRYETRFFEIGMPLNLHDFRFPMVGAYMRLYNITIGTDNLGGFANVANHYGFDLYVSLKISLIKNQCRRKQPRFCESGR